MGNKKRVAVVAATISLGIGGVLAPMTTQAAGAKPFNYQHLAKIQKRLVSGALSFQLEPVKSHGITPKIIPGGGDDEDGGGADGLPNTPPNGYSAAGGTSTAGNYDPSGNGACSDSFGSNVKVNQNCLNLTDAPLQGRGQANNETSIAVDPMHPKHLVASNNDYRRGDGTCGASYSLNAGRTWNDTTVPNGFTAGDTTPRQYWQAGGDTSVAWDTRGNSYLSCQLFNRGSATDPNPDQSSAFAVYRSTGNNGASFNFPGRYAKVFYDHPGTAGVLEDKQLLAVDNNVHSPFRDRVYVTFTEFAADGSGYIYATHSRDYGQTFSDPVLVSRTSSLCTNTFGLGTPNGTCNENQFSDPFVGKDGALYVVYANFNNTVSGGDNRNQMLLSKSTDGGVTFGDPIKVGDYYDLPDCQTYQHDDAGRACVPEKGGLTRSVFRATNYPSGAVDPTDPTKVVITYGSYINKNSQESNGCTPDGFSSFGTNTYTGVKKAGACNNDILISTSTDAGTTFSATNTDPRQTALVTQGSRQASTDQFWQWAAFTRSGTLAVSYYDRQYGRDEHFGDSDVSLSTSTDGTAFTSKRVTTSSMPPPTEFYGTRGGLFYGDYTGLSAVVDAYPIWSDTRNKDLFVCPNSATGPGDPPQVCSATEPNGLLANDEDIYTAQVPVS